MAKKDNGMSASFLFWVVSGQVTGGIVLSVERIERKERTYSHAQNKKRFRNRLKAL